MRLYGKKTVLERLRSNSQSIKELYLQKKVDLSELVCEAKRTSVSFKSVDKNEFKNICGDVHAQGVMAEVDEYEHASFNDVLNDCLNKKTILIFLDGVTDPQNLGSIIRNVACLGGFSIVLPEHKSVHVNETVLRVASGGENYINIAEVTNIATTIKGIRDKGVYVAGAVVGVDSDICEVEIPLPLAIVIGSEGKGIRPGISKYLDVGLSLPMGGAPLSYNVAVAATLFCYEINKKIGSSTPSTFKRGVPFCKPQIPDKNIRE